MKRARFWLLLLVAAALWLPNVHRFHTLDAPGRARVAAGLLAGQTGEGPDIAQMRAVNPEWDFMRRTYAVLALANLAVDAPLAERASLLAKIDTIVSRTLEDDRERGGRHFLMEYGQRGAFEDPETRSLFVDGELVMMIAARELVEPSSPGRRDEAQERAGRITRTMARSPSLSGESYPDECWTFCNTTALAGLALLDRVDGRFADEHAALEARWVRHAREHLVDARTGLLVSSYTRAGTVLDGPEGSSLWMSAHNLLLVDPAFAADQYARARRELRGAALGYAWAREWPAGTPPRPDVDSGPIVPWLDASAGSSGLALVGASAFGDHAYRDELLASLELAGARGDTGYRASNQVGDAVVLYALSFGPLWRRARS